MAVEKPSGSRYRRPGRGYYVLAVVVITAGSAFFGWQVYDGLEQAASSLVPLVVPGHVRLELSDAGTYTVFHEWQSVIDGRAVQTPRHADIDALVCEVTDVSGAPVPLTRPAEKLSYSVRGRRGTALHEFVAATPGTYRLSARYAGPSREPPIVLAVGRGMTALLGRNLAFGAIMLLVALVAGTTTIVVTSAKRRGRRRGRTR